MLFSRFALCTLTIAATVAAAGCSTTKPDAATTPVPAAVAAPAPAPQAAPDDRTVQPVQATAPQALDPLDDPQGALARRSVYFDFDKADIKSEYLALLTAHGEYLGGHHKRHVRIEGNCDERGSHEYNLALGQRRANGVRVRLQLLGMLDDQAETISFGKEKPRALGHDEESWAENRRADIVYQ